VPDVITYSALISACEKGSKPVRAVAVFQAMRRQHMVPSIITYSVGISICEKGNQRKQGLEIFKAMQRQGVVPDISIYSIPLMECEQQCGLHSTAISEGFLLAWVWDCGCALTLAPTTLP